MKKILLFAISITILLFSCKKSDDNKKFNGTSNTIIKTSDITYSTDAIKVNDFVVLSDGSLVVLANTKSMVGESRLALIKVDKNGSVVWTKTYETQSADYYTYGTTYAFSIEKDNSENLYISSEAQEGNGNTDGWILKTDKNGTKLWEKIFPTITHEGEYGSGNCVIANNGTVIFLFNPAEGQQSSCNLLIVSADGTQTQTVSVANNVYAGELKATSDNNLIVAGVSFDKSNKTKLVLTKLSLNGSVIWQKNTNTQPGTQHAFGMVESNGSFYVTGHFTADTAYNRNFLFAKFAADGTLTMMKNLGRNDKTTITADNDGLVINNLSNNNLVIGGYSQAVRSPYLTGELFMNLLDPEGNILMQDNLGGIGRIVAVKNTGKSSFIALGDLSPDFGYPSYRIIKYAY